MSMLVWRIDRFGVMLVRYGVSRLMRYVRRAPATCKEQTNRNRQNDHIDRRKMKGLTRNLSFSATSSRSFLTAIRGPLLIASRIRSSSATGFNHASDGSLSIKVSMSEGEMMILLSRGERLFRTD